MENIFGDKELVIIMFGILTSAIVFSMAFVLYSRMRKPDYNNIENRIVLEQMRSSIEKELYRINERLLSSENRWLDVNHLLVRRDFEAKPIDKLDTIKHVQLNEFLRSNGVNESDLTIEKELIFVLTPFNDYFEKDFNLIKRICDSVNLTCRRGDEEFHRGDIFSQVLKSIIKANLIIANINGRNPNVLYELGIAQALDKPTIFIAKSLEDIPIDIKSKRFIIYTSDEDLEKKLKAELLRIFVDKNNEPLSNVYKIGSNLKIIKATYGYSRNTFDITIELNRMIKNNKLDFVITNEIVGDPDPGSPKDLEITYTIDDKNVTIRKYSEGAKVVIQG